MTKVGRIDTHHHIVPPAYAIWLESKGVAAGGLAIPKWGVESDLALMDSIGVKTAILSFSTPGVNLGDDAEGRIKAREVNEFAADVVRKHPTRCGFFATLNLPDRGRMQKKSSRALQSTHDLLGYEMKFTFP